MGLPRAPDSVNASCPAAPTFVLEGGFPMFFLDSPLGKLALSLVLLAAIAPVVVWFFRGTWVELDAEALLLREQRCNKTALDARVMVTFLLG